jgi:hypothetical protein
VATINVLFVRFVVPETGSYDRIAIRQTGAAASGRSYVLGIYSDDGGRPKDRILLAGNASASGVGAKAIVIDVELEAGVVWLAIVANGDTTTPAPAIEHVPAGSNSPVSTTTGGSWTEPSGSTNTQTLSLNLNPSSGALPHRGTLPTEIQAAGDFDHQEWWLWSGYAAPLIWLRKSGGTSWS